MELIPMNIAILILTALGLAGSALVRRYTAHDRRVLLTSAARRLDIAQFIAEREACRSLRHDTLQLIEHALVFAGIVVWLWDVAHLSMVRTAIFLALWAVMSGNSVMDLLSRRRLMSHVARLSGRRTIR